MINLCFSVETQMRQKRSSTQLKPDEQLPGLDVWLAKQNKLSKPASEESQHVAVKPSPTEHKLPDCLIGRTDLPISLLPAPSEAWMEPPLEKWG